MSMDHDNDAHANRLETQVRLLEGNAQSEETIESLVNKFNKFGRATAEQLINRCEAVSQAKAKGKKAFEEFCKQVHFKPESSTARKYLRIGKESKWLLPIAHRLPAEKWTTIYDVAGLGQAKAETLVNRGILHPQATAKEIKVEAAKIAGVSDDVMSDTSTADETSSAKEQCLLQVDASDLSEQDRLQLYRELERDAALHGLRVTGLSDRLAKKLIIQQEAA